MTGQEKLPSLLQSPEAALAFMRDLAKRWLAHDGLWFQAVERECGMEAAMKMDAAAWETFTVLEAERIRRFFGLPADGGLKALREALDLRLYWFINQQETEQTENRVVFRMRNCRVQSARKRKNLPDFPCRPVGLVEYAGFARAIDPRIRTRCLACPPDEHPAEYFCAWEFGLDSEEGASYPLPTESRLASVLQSPARTLALMEDLAKRWLAHDGLWFQAVEKEYGLEAAIRMDTAAWAKFTVLEAERIRRFFHLPPDGGLPALREALPFRLDWLTNRQEIIDGGENALVFRTNVCRVQAARQRKNLAFFPCQKVGLVQLTGFARTIDPRIRTRCLVCPPSEPPGEYYCAWEFSI